MRKLLPLVAAAGISMFAMSASAQQKGVELGLLDCIVEGGAGFIIGSTKDVKCTYTPADKKFAPEVYRGEIRKIGLDVGVTGTTLIQWAVLAPSANKYAAGALAGNYVGVSAEATAAIGVGANLLVGGSDKSFTLQPLSIQEQSGVNLAVGVTEFVLQKAPAG